jgi:hypothetical protein
VKYPVLLGAYVDILAAIPYKHGMVGAPFFSRGSSAPEFKDKIRLRCGVGFGGGAKYCSSTSEVVCLFGMWMLSLRMRRCCSTDERTTSLPTSEIIVSCKIN